MVIDSPLFEQQIHRFINEAKSELSTLQSEAIELRSKIVALEQEINAYDKVLQSYQKRTGKQDYDTDWNNLMSGSKNHKDRIIITIKQMGGITKPKNIVDILYNKGFIKSKKRANAYQIVQRGLVELVEKGTIEKLESGDYRLLGSQPNLPMVTQN
jgi:hypothetical protein